MAKSGNRKKKKNGVAAMDVSAENKEDLPQEMDTTETIAQTPRSQVPGVLNRKIKKGGVPLKRAKNIRKMKAIQKAISRDEKKEEKSLKHVNKVLRTQSAKTLYDMGRSSHKRVGNSTQDVLNDFPLNMHARQRDFNRVKKV